MSFFEDLAKVFVLGSFAGHTSNKVRRLIEEDLKGETTDDYTDDDVKYAIVSPNIWALNGTKGANRILRLIQAANQENADAAKAAKEEDGEEDADPDQYRIWLCSLDWVHDCLEEGHLLDPEDYDYERIELHKRDARAKMLAEDRKKNGGVSKYKPGERRRLEIEARVKREVAEVQAQLDLEEREEKARVAREEREEAYAKAMKEHYARIESMKVAQESAQAARNTALIEMAAARQAQNLSAASTSSTPNPTRPVPVPSASGSGSGTVVKPSALASKALQQASNKPIQSSSSIIISDSEDEELTPPRKKFLPPPKKRPLDSTGAMVLSDDDDEDDIPLVKRMTDNEPLIKRVKKL